MGKRKTNKGQTLDQRRKAHAARIGVDEARVASVQLDLQQVRLLGTLVDVDIHGVSMFTRHASLDEWGVPRLDVRANRLNRGSKNLIPRKYLGRLRSLEVRFRASLEKHSRVLEGFKPYHWVPFTAYDSWQEEWSRLQDEWSKIKQEILDNYDTLRTQLEEDFAKLAAEAYQAIRARKNGETPPKAAFIKQVVQHALAQFPTRERIERELYVDYKPAMIAGAEDIEADLVARDHLRQIRDRQAAEARLAEQKVKSAQQELWKQERDADTLRSMRLATEEAKLTAMRQAELAHAKEQLAKTISPWEELFQQLRSQMYQDTIAVLASIQKNGYLTGKVMKKAKGMVETFRLFNVHGDGELEQMLTSLQAALAAKTNQKDTRVVDMARIYVALNGIKAATAEAAEEVRKRAEPGMWGALEV